MSYLFYLKKAFDVVDHAIQLRKLETYKFDRATFNWVASMLLTRLFIMQIRPKLRLKHLQSGTSDYKSWFCSNGMHIHQRKTSLMMLGYLHTLSANDILHIADNS